MREQVAVTRHTLQEAPDTGGGRVANHRRSGRRFVLLVVLACASVLAIAATPAQAAGLPDGRAYELVTPANNDNDAPYLRAGIFGGYQAAGTGNGFSYPSLETFPGSQSVGLSFLSTRSSSGWTATNVLPPQTVTTGALCGAMDGAVGYSSDMSKVLFADGAASANGCPTHLNPLPGVNPATEPQGTQNLYVSNLTNGTYQLVDPIPVTGSSADATFLGGSTDLSHVVFAEAAQLTSDAPGGGASNLYEWVSGSGASLVTEVPTSGASCTGAACTPTTGSIASGVLPYHAVSDDGSNVFFTANNGVNTNLYDRQNATSTTQIDASVGGGGQFLAASADGSKVYFTAGGNLYEYDFSSSSSQPTNLTPAGVGAIDGLAGISDDGSYIYFVGHTTSGMNPGPPTLYVSHNGGTPTMITALDPSDSGDWNGFAARASSNGQFLVFNSIDQLTGFNNTDANTSSPDDEIFIYNAADGSINCASCFGGAPVGNTLINATQTSGIPDSSTTILARYVSDTGQVFFDTPNALLPNDTDGTPDVYEYENGQVSLLSNGADPQGARYTDSTADGSNVYFATVEPLVPQDVDGGAYSVYDARVGGGFPFSPPAPACQGEGCKPSPTPAPAAPTAASITFSGPGNPTPGSRTTTAKVRVVKRTVKGTTIKLHVNVPAGGTIVVTGAKRVTLVVHHSATYTITVHLTGKENRLKNKRKLTLKLKVKYTPVAGRISTANVKLTVKA
jgi:hypothetical protein